MVVSILALKVTPLQVCPFDDAARKDLEEKAEKKRRQLSKRLKTAAEFEEAFDGASPALKGSSLRMCQMILLSAQADDA